MTQMIEVKTAELIGPALDWAVDAIESGKPLEIRHHKNGSGEWIFVADGVPYPSGPRKFSTDWSQGGPLIDREGTFRIIGPKYKGTTDHVARLPKGVNHWFEMYGPTPLIAAMRCLVASKLGEVVMVPKELLP